MGRGGRRPGAKANGILLFNARIYDKRLGLWLKSALDCQENDHLIQQDKADVLLTYEKSWRFIYSLYHGKCLSWVLSHFYGGADDDDPPTCFTANAPGLFVQFVEYLMQSAKKVVIYKIIYYCYFKQSKP